MDKEFTIGTVVAKNALYTVHACIPLHSEIGAIELLAQVANGVANNDAITRNAFVLSKLDNAATELETEYAKLGKGMLNYHLSFPEVYDTALFENSKANIVRFRNIKDVTKVIPLLKVWKSGLKIDLRTSAWIMGKLLKILAFAHDQDIKVNTITGNNILIEPDQHYVLLFDWSRSVLGKVPASTKREEVKMAAQCVVRALGGNLDAARVNDADIPYTDYLHTLYTRGDSDATKAHRRFYEVVDSLCSNPDSVWKTGFYPFTTAKL